MEKLFKIRYWDYTNYKINFKGYIALIPSLTWGVLTIFMTRFLHKYVEMLVLGISGDIIAGITYVISVIFIVDFTLSFKSALDLKDVLAGMENAREEMVRIKRRLDVVIALVNDDASNRKKEFPYHCIRRFIRL